jgi:hypothetical protein
MSKYAVSLLLQKNDGTQYTFSHSLHVHEAVNKDEAIGLSVKAAQELKVGFAISDPLCMEVSND